MTGRAGDGVATNDAVRVTPCDPRDAARSALRVDLPPRELAMTNPSVAPGPLGGLALPGVDAPVLAQRHALVDGVLRPVSIDPLGGGRYRLREEEQTARLTIDPTPGRGRCREVVVDGFRFEVEVESERLAALRERATRGREASGHRGPVEVLAIIPGRVVSLSVAPGDDVTAGQQLLAVEAMKMQNELRSPRDGTVLRVGVSLGATINVGDVLVVIS